MAILIGALLLSTIPSVILYFWLKGQNKEEAEYGKTCRKDLFGGMLAVFPLFLLDLALSILGKYVFLKNAGPVAVAAYGDFVLHGFVEEFIKFMIFKRILDKVQYRYSWRDLTAFLICVAIGFHLFEAFLYMFETNPGQILVRGVLAMHSGYAYIMGKYYGKAKATGNKAWYAVAFAVPWLLHSFYDFGLSPELGEELTVWSFLSVTLAGVSLVIFVLLVRFFLKAKKDGNYTRPLGEFAGADK